MTATDGIERHHLQRGAQQAELSLYPEQPADSGMDAWFARRIETPMQQVRSAHTSPPEVERQTLWMTHGEGRDAAGERVYVMRLGCQRPGGRLAMYGELWSSTAEAFVRESVPAAVGRFLDRCKAPPATVTRAPSPAAGGKEPTMAAAQAGTTGMPVPFSKPAGQGLRAADVEAVVHTWSETYRGTGMHFDETLYLMLKDGSYRQGLPRMPLDEFDAAGERAAQPKGWGRWRKKGADYEVASSARPGDFMMLRRQSLRLPARPGEQLDGTYRSDTAAATPWAVSRSTLKVSFSKDGRFWMRSDGSTVGGVGSAGTGNAVHGAITRTDDASTSTVGGTNFGGGASASRPSTEADRSGTYRLDGYAIELRFDSGRVSRLPYYVREDRKAIWFAGREMTLDTGSSR